MNPAKTNRYHHFRKFHRFFPVNRKYCFRSTLPSSLSSWKRIFGSLLLLMTIVLLLLLTDNNTNDTTREPETRQSTVQFIVALYKTMLSYYSSEYWSGNRRLEINFTQFAARGTDGRDSSSSSIPSLFSFSNDGHGNDTSSSGGRNSRAESARVVSILFWTPFFNYDTVGLFREHLNTCSDFGFNASDSDCQLTVDRSRLDQAHAVVYHGPNTPIWDIPVPRPPNTFHVFMSYEAVDNDPVRREVWNYFQWSYTFRSISDFPGAYGAFEAVPSDEHRRPDGSSGFPNSTGMNPNRNNNGNDSNGTNARQQQSERLRKWTENVRNKTGLVAWLVSNCHTLGRREEYVRELRKYIKVDVFGKCNDRPCHGECYQNISRYKFYLALENTVCAEYVTEKVYSRMNAPFYTVPIVLSQTVAAGRLPLGSFIALDQFPHGPRQLAEHLLDVDQNHTLFMQYFEWRKTHRLTHPIEPMCLLCQKLKRLLRSEADFNEEIRRVNGRNLSNILDPDANCIPEYALKLIPNYSGLRWHRWL